MSERILNVHIQEYNGKKFRSTLEAKTAEVLDALGIPYAYENRKIELQSGFRSPFQKDKIRSITYTPDFIIGSILLECKGFETPEWKIKKKLLFKWLMENEPCTAFYQIHDAKKELLQVLSTELSHMNMLLEVTSKPTKKQESVTKHYNSIEEAFEELGLKGKPVGAILKSLTAKEDKWVYGYKWKLIKTTNYDDN